MNSDLGIIGLGIMGTSLARNLARNDFRLSLFNRYLKGSEEQVAQYKIEKYKELKNAIPFEDIASFVASLSNPRRILLTLTTGSAIDTVVGQLIPFLESGDLIIDGGNSHYTDTERRLQEIESHGMYFLGLGISGGEEGALRGPSLMPGGSKEAYDLSRDFLTSMAAVTPLGEKACAYVGNGGAGHFVKMVHNAIEYVEMQCIAEHFEIMNKVMKISYEKIADIFEQWNEEFESYLLEISVKILRTKDGNTYLLDRILDKASFNQTGYWTLITAIQNFETLSLVSSALFSRYTSNQLEDRVGMSQLKENKINDLSLQTSQLKSAYRFTRIINHYQNFHLIASFSKTTNWKIDMSQLCMVWSAGCIIKSKLLSQLNSVLKKQFSPFFDPQYFNQLSEDQEAIATLVSKIAVTDIPLPCMSQSLTYFKQMTQKNSSANMIQAQRDFFGSHGFEIIGEPTGTLYHHKWDR